MKTKILVLGLAAMVAGCGGTNQDTQNPNELGTVDADAFIAPDPGVPAIERWRYELLKEDRAFNLRVQMEGMAAWAEFFAPDGAMIQPMEGEVRGREAIDAAFRSAVLSEGLLQLAWEPDRAEVSNGGDLGYTVGTYRTISQDSAGVQTTVKGRYVSIWRRQDDGTWRVEMDLGNPTTPPEVLSGTTAGAPGGATP